MFGAMLTWTEIEFKFRFDKLANVKPATTDNKAQTTPNKPIAPYE